MPVHFDQDRSRNPPFLLCLVVGFMACGDADPADPLEPELPSTGAVRVSMSVDGAGTDPDGLVITVDGVSRRIEIPGATVFSDVPKGEHRVVLSDYQPNCTTISLRSANVTVDPDATAEAFFDLRCVPTAYVSHSSSVSVVRTTWDESIVTGGYSRKVALAPDGRYLYVPLADFNVVEIIDLDRSAVVKRVPVGDVPVDIAFSADGTHAYVANEQARTITRIDVASSSVDGTFPVAGNPAGVAVTASGIVFVASIGGEITIIDRDGTSHFMHPGDAARYVEISNDDRLAWVSNGSGSTVRVIDTSTWEVVRTVAMEGYGEYGGDIALTPDGRDVFLAHTNDDFLSVISAERGQVEQTIALELPSKLEITPDGSLLYVSTFVGKMYVVDVAARRVVDSVSVAHGPGGIALGDTRAP